LHRQPQQFVERRLLWILAAIMALSMGVAWGTPLRRYLLPWIGNDAGQAVLSWGHLLDILNEILLVFPAAVLFLGLLWSAGGPIPWVRAAPPPATVKQPSQSRRFHGKRRQLSAPDTTPVQWLRTRAEWQFFGLGAWGCLLYLLFFEAAIGVARDWDLFSMIAVPLVPLALIAWNRHMHIAGGFDAHKYAIVVTPMLTMTLVMCLSWVVLNHSVGRAAQRFEWILGWESARVAYGLEALAATYYDHGHPGDAVRVMERAIVVSPNKRLRSLLGTYHYDLGNYERARELLAPEVERTPEDSNIRAWLIRTLYKLEEYGMQEDVVREGVRLDPANSQFQLLLGELLLKRGEIAEGVHHLRLGRRDDMPGAARQHIDALIERYGAP
jgi:hypothetical protein